MPAIAETGHQSTFIAPEVAEPAFWTLPYEPEAASATRSPENILSHDEAKETLTYFLREDEDAEQLARYMAGFGKEFISEFNQKSVHSRLAAVANIMSSEKYKDFQVVADISTTFEPTRKPVLAFMPQQREESDRQPAPKRFPKPLQSGFNPAAIPPPRGHGATDSAESFVNNRSDNSEASIISLAAFRNAREVASRKFSKEQLESFATAAKTGGARAVALTAAGALAFGVAHAATSDGGMPLNIGHKTAVEQSFTAAAENPAHIPPAATATIIKLNQKIAATPVLAKSTKEKQTAATVISIATKATAATTQQTPEQKAYNQALTDTIKHLAANPAAATPELQAQIDPAVAADPSVKAEAQQMQKYLDVAAPSSANRTVASLLALEQAGDPKLAEHAKVLKAANAIIATDPQAAAAAIAAPSPDKVVATTAATPETVVAEPKSPYKNFETTFSDHLSESQKLAALEILPTIISVAKQENIQPEILLAISYEEHGFAISNPSNGQGPFQNTSGHYAPGPSNLIEFRVAAVEAAKLEKQKAKTMPADQQNQIAYGALDLNNQWQMMAAGNLLERYNGKPKAYDKQAAGLGYNAVEEAFMGSPYVSAMMDDQHNSDKNPNFKQYKYDHDGHMSPANTRPGALVIASNLTELAQNDPRFAALALKPVSVPVETATPKTSSAMEKILEQIDNNLPSDEAGQSKILAQEVLSDPNITIAPSTNDEVKQSIVTDAKDGKTFIREVSGHEVVTMNPYMLRTALALSKAGFQITVWSVTTGEHAKHSDHYNGTAMDVSLESGSLTDFQKGYKFLYDNREALGLDQMIFGQALPSGTSLISDGKDVAPSFYGDATLKEHKGHIHFSTLLKDKILSVSQPVPAPSSS